MSSFSPASPAPESASSPLSGGGGAPAPGPLEERFRPRSAPKPRRKKPWEMGLLACGIGCAVVLVASVVVALVGLRWMVGGDQVATSEIVGQGSVGAFQMDRPMEDEGSRELLLFLMSELQRVDGEQSTEDMPEFIRRMEEMNRANQTQGNAQSLGMIVPKEMTFTLEPIAPDAADLDGEEDQRALVGAVNLAAFSRTLRWFIEGKGDNVASYRGHQIAAVDDELFYTFHGDTLLGSDHRGALEQVVDRLEDRPSDRGDEESSGRWRAESPMASPLVPEERGGYDFYGAVRNYDGAQSDWLTGFELMLLEMLGAGMMDWVRLPEANSDEVQEIFLGIDVLSADQVRMDLAFACSDEQAAQRWRTRLIKLLRTEPRVDEELDLAAEIETSAQGAVTRGSLDLRGLRPVLSHLLDEMVQDEYSKDEYGYDEGNYDDTYYEDAYEGDYEGDYEDGYSDGESEPENPATEIPETALTST
ncbi:MAG: hypothetical protein AAGD01_14275 [Acidobacteriota bacterium]